MLLFSDAFQLVFPDASYTFENSIVTVRVEKLAGCSLLDKTDSNKPHLLV